MCGHRAACSQVFAVLFYAQSLWGHKLICVGDIRVSRLQVKGRQHYLRQNIGPAIAVSAGPVPPALSCMNGPYNYIFLAITTKAGESFR